MGRAIAREKHIERVRELEGLSAVREGKSERAREREVRELFDNGPLPYTRAHTIILPALSYAFK